ncbi:SMP-30/gluconolactonase/LRE family protein [Chromobacterium vaccinii]|uniref:hypothetical protein n=1 Tax=Chromobacterium vaccinii TaxID=1108595 RepID=UPI001642453B|nr:hypothetical protein [Chromobacterium vaccinii]
MYVLDIGKQELAVVDLQTQQKIYHWSLINPVFHSTQLVAVRTNGVDVVILGDGTAYKDGKSYSNTGLQGWSLSATDDGSKVYATTVKYIDDSHPTMGVFSIDYSEVGSGTLHIWLENVNKPAWGGQGVPNFISVSGDGKYLYTATNSSYQCLRIDTESFMLSTPLVTATLDPRGLYVLSDGRVMCAAVDSSGVSSVTLFERSGGAIKSYPSIGKMTRRGLLVSSDDAVMVEIAATSWIYSLSEGVAYEPGDLVFTPV